MTPEEWATIHHFKAHEFDSPDEPGSGARMRYELVARLDRVRAAAMVPFRVNSGIRSAAHNAKVGGVDSSAHVNGWAADIALDSEPASEKRALIVMQAVANGFRRIGIGETFVHLDCDPSKPAPRIWTYK